MDGRPRTKAAKKRIARIKDERRLAKNRSKVMPMLTRPMLLRVNKKKPGAANAKPAVKADAKPAAKVAGKTASK